MYFGHSRSTVRAAKQKERYINSYIIERQMSSRRRVIEAEQAEKDVPETTEEADAQPKGFQEYLPVETAKPMGFLSTIPGYETGVTPAAKGFLCFVDDKKQINKTKSLGEDHSTVGLSSRSSKLYSTSSEPTITAPETSDDENDSTIWDNDDELKIRNVQDVFSVDKILPQAFFAAAEIVGDEAFPALLMDYLVYYDVAWLAVGFCVKAEIDRTASPAVLFREDSSFTRGLSAFSLCVGHHYLKKVLKEIIHEITGCKDELEIESARCPDESAREANTYNLCQLCSRVLKILAFSVESAPADLRWMLSLVKDHVTQKWPGVSGNRGVGAFFMLRFICAYLVVPEKFELCKTVTPQFRRRLILVSKILQMLSNEQLDLTDYPKSLKLFVNSHTLAMVSIFNDLLMKAAESKKKHRLSKKTKKNIKINAKKLMDFIQEHKEQIKKQIIEIDGSEEKGTARWNRLMDVVSTIV